MSKPREGMVTFAPWEELGRSVAPSSVFSRKLRCLFFYVNSDHVVIILCRPPTDRQIVST